jgi:hypothetical protein
VMINANKLRLSGRNLYTASKGRGVFQ